MMLLTFELVKFVNNHRLSMQITNYLFSYYYKSSLIIILITKEFGQFFFLQHISVFLTKYFSTIISLGNFLFLC